MVTINNKEVPFPYNILVMIVIFPFLVAIFLFLATTFLVIAAVLLSPILIPFTLLFILLK